MQLVISYVVIILASALAALLPVKLAATKLQVTKSGWLYSVIAVILSVIITNAASYVIPIIFIAIPVAIGVVGFVYESILETTFKKGLYIAVIAVLIQFMVTSFMLSTIFH